MAILGEVFSIIRNGASIKQIDGANGFPITRIETISNRVIDRNRLGYANVFDITEYESYVLQSGDILMSHINSEKHLGKTALYIKKGNEKIIHGMNLLMLRANSEVILPLYAKYFFDSNLFLKQIPNITKKSVNQASFTVTALKKLEIKIPQMVEQKRIIDIMSRLDNIIQYRKDQLEKLDLFVKSRFVVDLEEVA
ncbi:restriction endonuclease subunit S [uncultured Phascolarctobacterium sp.]|uniref:restriction endonuclease subunit S n=1 Tax=uncultured Phascolarctobacterium sp. TaxID=512296 RepID=UPI0025DC53BD|nr:restriction endonuclease subunit S [uncultured Phascolarctobacterium sp.]MDD7714820.1 restriction endonuclease subunit S [Mollicutes bacterium]